MKVQSDRDLMDWTIDDTSSHRGTRSFSREIRSRERNVATATHKIALYKVIALLSLKILDVDAAHRELNRFIPTTSIIRNKPHSFPSIIIFTARGFFCGLATSP